MLKRLIFNRFTLDTPLYRELRRIMDERQNSLFFGSHRMARASAVYHTVISTCRAQGVSALEYLKKFFHAIVKGRRDYANLTPILIGLNVKDY